MSKESLPESVVSSDSEQVWSDTDTASTNSEPLSDFDNHSSSSLSYNSEASGLKRKASTRFRTFGSMLKQAKEDLQVEHPPFASDVGMSDLMKKIMADPQAIYSLAQEFHQQGTLQDYANTKRHVLSAVMNSPRFQAASEVHKQALLLSHAGISVGKVAQIMSADETLDPNMREICTVMLDGCAESRNLNQAKALANTMYEGRYDLHELAATGSIGEVYFATRKADGKKVVIKMRKEGTNEASLKAEHEAASAILKQMYKDNPQKLTYKKILIDNLFSKWKTELDFSGEAKNAENLGKALKKAKVAQCLETAKLPGTDYPTSMVQEAAEGLPFSKLTKMVEDYKADPKTYEGKHPEIIKSHPWARNPDKWMDQLPKKYLSCINEQLATKWFHADTQPGNVFGKFNEKTGKLEATWIDAGLVGERSYRECAQHMGTSLYSLVGSSKNLAKNMVNSAENQFSEPERNKIIADITDNLDREVYRVHANATDSKYINGMLDALMEKHGIHISEEKSLVFKMLMQSQMVYRQLSEATKTGNGNFAKDSLPKVPGYVAKIWLKAPIETTKHLAKVTGHCFASPKNSFRVAAQFFVSHAVK